MKNTCKFNFVSKLAGRMFLRTNFFIDTTLLTIQRWINVVSTLQITVQITVILRWKWSKTGIRVFNVAQHCYNVGMQGCNNVAERQRNRFTTLHNVASTLFQRYMVLSQRCFNMASTSVKGISKQPGWWKVWICRKFVSFNVFFNISFKFSTYEKWKKTFLYFVYI